MYGTLEQGGTSLDDRYASLPETEGETESSVLRRRDYIPRFTLRQKLSPVYTL